MRSPLRNSLIPRSVTGGSGRVGDFTVNPLQVRPLAGLSGRGETTEVSTNSPALQIKWHGAMQKSSLTIKTVMVYEDLWLSMWRKTGVGGWGAGFEQDTDDDGEAWNVICYFDRSRAGKIIIKISPILPFSIPCIPNPPIVFEKFLYYSETNRIVFFSSHHISFRT